MPQDLPGLYWDEAKKRYFPKSSKRKVKKATELPENQQNSFLRRPNAFQMRIERVEFVKMPFQGSVVVLSDSTFAIASNFTVQFQDCKDENFKIKSEKTFTQQIQSIHCTKSYLAVVFVPKDLDSPSLDVNILDFDLNLIEELSVINFPLQSILIQDVQNNIVFIDQDKKLICGSEELCTLKGEPRALFYRENVGIVVASTSGRISVFKDGQSRHLKLASSSAKRIFYHAVLNSLLLLTFHQQIVRLDLESSEQSILVEEAPESIEQCAFNENYFFFSRDKSVSFIDILNSNDSFKIDTPCEISTMFIEQNRIFFQQNKS